MAHGHAVDASFHPLMSENKICMSMLNNCRRRYRRTVARDVDAPGFVAHASNLDVACAKMNMQQLSPPSLWQQCCQGCLARTISKTNILQISSRIHEANDLLQVFAFDCMHRWEPCDCHLTENGYRRDAYFWNYFKTVTTVILCGCIFFKKFFFRP